MSDKSKEMQCSRHGTSHATFLCYHLLGGEGLGFVEAYDPDNPEDPRPDAWCLECDGVLTEEGAWNDRSEAFADIKVVCAHCYDVIRRRNITSGDGIADGINRIWFLQDAFAWHREYPASFQLPDKALREDLQVGDYAKLIFFLPTGGESEDLQAERMWVRVDDINHVGYYGTLESSPITEGSLRRGDLMLFGPEHVVDLIDAEDALELDFGGEERITLVRDRENIVTSESSDRPGEFEQ